MKKTMLPTLAALLLTVLLTCTLAAESGGPQLQRLRHIVVSPSLEQVVLQLNGSYSPKVFTLKGETPRIVFDFPGMTHGHEIKGVTTTNGTLVKRIRVGMQTQNATKTRIVFDMDTLKGVTYSQRFDQGASTLTVSFTGPPQAIAAGNGAKKVTDKEKVATKDKKTAQTTASAAKTVKPLAAKADAADETKPAPKPEGAAVKAKTDGPAQEALPQTADSADKTVTKADNKPPTTSSPAPQPDTTAETKPAPKPEGAAIGVKTGGPVQEALPQIADSVDKTVAKTDNKTPTASSPAPQADTAAETKPAPKPEDVAVKAKTDGPVQEALPQTADSVDKTVTKIDNKTPTTLSPAALADTTAETKPAPKPESAAIEAKTKGQVQEAPPQTAESVDKIAAKADDKKPPTAGTVPPPQPQPQSAATQTEAKTATDKGAATKPALLTGPERGPQLESIKFDGTSPKGEMVLFKLNDFYPPVIHGVEEGVPRVICDFNNTKLVYAGKNLIKANGKFVKLIRITRNKKPERVRVVLDLEPNQSYDLQQVFFKEDNLFVIIVNTVKK